MIQNKKKMGYLFWLTVMAAIALAGLTIYQAYDKVESDNIAIKERKNAEDERNRADLARQETKFAQDKSAKYLNDLKNANEKIQILNEQSLRKADEIIRKNEEVIKSQTETIRSVTGFGTPIAVAGRSGVKDGHFYILNKGNYNLKNLTVNIYDFSNGLKAHLKNNSLLKSTLDENLIGTGSIVTLAPYSTLIVDGAFDFSQFKAFEIRMNSDHAEFREFFICQFNESRGLIEHFYYKLYEIDRLTLEWHLIEQEPKNSNKDDLFEKYFILHSYQFLVK